MLDNQENIEDKAEGTSNELEVNNTENNNTVELPEVKNEKTTIEKAVEEIEDQIAEDAEKDDEKNTISMLEYDNMELETLTDELKKLLKNHPIQQIKNHVEAIKSAFNIKFGKLLADKKAAFLADGGESIDFQFSSPVKTTYNSLLAEYKTKRDSYYSELDKRLKDNLERRRILIDELKNLIENADPKTMYKEFQGIQNRWREIGPVPRNKYNDTWRNYHHHVERFYDLLHLSNDFRDLDFKHNLEEKLKLISRVEDLQNVQDINIAFKELQEIHKTWKENIGPVSQEHRESVWQRFSEASKKIHDKRHEYFKSLRSKHQEIIEKKLEVIALINAYDVSNNKTHNDWQKSINDLEALRQKYFDIGKLPYSKSEAVWQKFKAATNRINKAKNNFYKDEKKIQQDNLDKKRALIELAASYKDSDDWETATNIMKRVQADWKKIGHVPRKFSDPLWKEFKETCNYYFNRLHNKQTTLSKEQEAFVDDKKALLDEVKAIENATIETIDEYIKKWRDLGNLPRNVRHLEAKFNKQIDTLLEKLSMSSNEIEMLKFKNLIDGYLQQEDSYKLNSELNFVRKKVDENIKEIQQLENNLSFFSTTDDNNPLVKNVKKNIENLKKDNEIWNNKFEYLKNLEY